MEFEPSLSRENKKLLTNNPRLVYSEMKKVVSHVQRNIDGWVLNTLMLDGVGVPFRYKRKETYQCLKGARVNITYYPATEKVAGIEMEIMKVVKLKRS